MIPEPSSVDEGRLEIGELLQDFYARSTRPHAIQVRQLLRKWYGWLDKKAQEQIKGRLASRDDRVFLSIFTELASYALFRAIGHDPEFVTNGIGDGALTPDFVVKSPDGDSFLAEATSTRDPGEMNHAEQARMNDLYRAIEAVDAPQWYFSLEVDGVPTRSPARSKIVREIAAWVAEHDYQSELARKLARKDPPTRTFVVDENCEFELGLLPILPSNVGPGFRKIGLSSSGGMFQVQTKSAIRRAIVKKNNRYSSLDEPFVVVVNVVSGFVDEDDVLQALLGDLVHSFHPLSETTSTRIEPNGAWRNRHGPQYRENSAVVVFENFTPSHLFQGKCYVVHNPWAKYPLRAAFPALPAIHLRDGGAQLHIDRHPGTPLDRILT